MYVIGLDISTSSTGVCVTDLKGNLVFLDCVKLKSPIIFNKSLQINSLLAELNKKYSISSIFIEENLQAFRPGLSSAKTLLTLARFNGMVSQLCHLEFKIIPQYINVNSARKNLDIKIISKRKGGKPTKEQVHDWATIQLPSFVWPEKKLKSGPRKDQIILDPGCYDMADAYVIARAGILNI